MDLSERGQSRDRVVVVGAGLTGLTAAYRLVTHASTARRPVEVVVLDAKERIGGAIWTKQVDGFTLEGGADSFITNKPWARELCRELGLGDQIISTDDRHRRSFVVRNGKLLAGARWVRFDGSRQAWPTPDVGRSCRSAASSGCCSTSPSPGRPTIPTRAWRRSFRRRLGREALDRLVQPLVGGIYTADPNELSLKATLPQFPQMEQTHGSLILGSRRQARQAKAADRAGSGARYGLFNSLAGGMATLPRTLAAALPPRTIRLNTAVRRVSRSGPESTLAGRTARRPANRGPPG